MRQSRVAIIRKLIREAKILQARKHGDEKILEKCKRKAQKLLAEIAALKKLKDDEIIKFSITNTRTLQEVLCNVTCKPSERAMTRIAFHKSLSDKIAKFKEKFPEYEQHLGPGRKKLSKIQRKADRDARKALVKVISSTDKKGNNEIVNGNASEESGNHSNEKEEEVDTVRDSENEEESVEESENEEESIEGSENEEDEKQEDAGDSETECDPASNSASKTDELYDEEESHESFKEALPTMPTFERTSILGLKAHDSIVKKRKIDNGEQINSVSSKPCKTIKTNHKKEKVIKTEKLVTKPKKAKTIKVVCKEAMVRRFMVGKNNAEQPTEEIIEEVGTTTKSNERDKNIEKQVDSFFMTADGDSDYLSVVIPKTIPCEQEEQNERLGEFHTTKRQQYGRQDNFNNNDQRKNDVGRGRGARGRGERFDRNSRGRINTFEYSRDPPRRFDGGSKFERNIKGKQTNNFRDNKPPPAKFGRAENGVGKPARNSKSEIENRNGVKPEELHPSWAARKKEQEILKQGFQGKKIVFDF